MNENHLRTFLFFFSAYVLAAGVDKLADKKFGKLALRDAVITGVFFYVALRADD